MNKLAIVIPYYKMSFFEETLKSVANQTDKRFILYIGNDNSPDDPIKLIEKYFPNKTDYRYFNFIDNLGGTSLADQWERIIDNVEEDWFQILGDDDMIADNFVEEFYKNIEEVEDNQCNVIKISQQWIDENNVIRNTPTKYPKLTPYYYSIYAKYSYEIRSSLSEHIFNLSAYKKKRFRKYPLAWCSDDMALLDFSLGKPIFFISNTVVSVRMSLENISGKEESQEQKDNVYQCQKDIMNEYAKFFPRKIISKVIKTHIFYCNENKYRYYIKTSLIHIFILTYMKIQINKFRIPILNMIEKIFRKINKLLHPVIGEIWCLHRVVPSRSIFIENRELEITPEYLEKLISDCQSNGYSFLSIDDVVANLSKFTLVKKKNINISFDDGFEDIYSYAYPIFLKNKIPFTIYLTTDFPDKKVNLWWITLENIILENDKIELLDNRVFECKNEKQKKEVYTLLISEIFNSKLPTFDAFKSMFGSDCKTDLAGLLLNWEQLKEMVDSGLCTIGSHTVTHPNLTKLETTDVLEELRKSKKYIADKLNCEVNHFSYPHSFQNEKVQKLVEEEGYITATLGYGGTILRGDNPFLLKRNYIVQK